MRIVLFCLNSLLITIFLLSFSIPVVSASSTLFFDDFVSASLGSSYDYYVNNGTILLSDSQLKLSAPLGVTYPSVHLNYTLPSDNYSIEIKFQFNNAARYGIGALMGDVVLQNGVAPRLEDLIYYNWGDSQAGREYRYLNSSGQMITSVTLQGLTDWHIEKYERIGNSNLYYLDGVLLNTSTTSRKVSQITIGNTDNRGIYVDNWTSIYVDYIQIQDLTGESEYTFSPYYSQKDELWKSDLYDDSPSWAGADKYGIDRWGCALSSVAMVLGKYDIKSPTGEPSTPKVLNFWLKNQNDGYIGNGLINWLAITRYSKLSETAGFAPHSLEYTREPYSASTVATRIADSKYPILPLNGHYVLSYALDGSDLVVADPNKSAAERIATSSAFARMNVLTPSHTDLSYMMFVGPAGTGFSGSGIDSYTESISDDVEGTAKTNVVAIVPKPAVGTYNLHVTGNGSWNSYFYDQGGNVSKNTLTINGAATDYQIVYDPVVGHSSSIAPLDDAAPAVSTFSPTNGSFVKGLVNIVGSIADDNPNQYQLTIKNNLGEIVATTGVIYSGNIDNQTLYAWDTTLVNDGTYSIILQATDVYTNSGSTSISVIADNTTPSLSVIDPPIVATDSGEQTWSWSASTDSGSGLKGYYTRSYDVVTNSHPTDWLWLGDILSTTTTHDGGVWKQEIKSEDNIGNITPAVVSGPVYIDHSAPVLYSKTAWSGDWYNTPQTAYFDYTDNNLVSDYIAPTCEIASEGFFAGCSVLPHVCDNSGNCNTNKVWSNTIKLDSTKPKNGFTLWGSRIAGWASDNMSGIVKVEVVYRKDNGEEHTEVATGRTSWSYSLPSPIVGSYEVAIYSYDVAGNRSEATTKSFTINPSDSPRQTGPVTTLAFVEPVTIKQVTAPGIVLGASIIPTPTPSPIQAPQITPAFIPAAPKQQSYWPYIVAAAIILPITLLLFMILRR